MSEKATGPNERRVDRVRVGLFVSCVIISAVLTFFFSGTLSNKPDVLAFISSVFAILAGVLIAVISILGDPSMLLDQSWRHSYLSARETQRKIHRQTDIFILYVLLLCSLFLFLLCAENTTQFRVMQIVCFFLTVCSFQASLTLPFSLREIQRKRLDKAIEHLRR